MLKKSGINSADAIIILDKFIGQASFISIVLARKRNFSTFQLKSVSLTKFSLSISSCKVITQKL